MAKVYGSETQEEAELALTCSVISENGLDREPSRNESSIACAKRATEDLFDDEFCWTDSVEVWLMVGKMGSGKDYVMNHFLKPLLPWSVDLSLTKEVRELTLAFADYIKLDAIAKKRVPFREVYGEKTEQSRQALQRAGTENGRDVHGRLVWVKHVLVTMYLHHVRSGVTRFFLSDCRFPEELVTFKLLFGDRARAVKVVAPERNRLRLLKEAKGDPEKAEELSRHASEVSLDHTHGSLFYRVFENDEGQGTYENFFRCIKGNSDPVETEAVGMDADPSAGVTRETEVRQLRESPDHVDTRSEADKEFDSLRGAFAAQGQMYTELMAFVMEKEDVVIEADGSMVKTTPILLPAPVPVGDVESGLGIGLGRRVKERST